MAEKKPLSPKAKKALIYGGIGAVAIAAIYVSTLTTEKAPPIAEPTSLSLTGNADTRAVSLEGLNRRLAELETGGKRQSDDMRSELDRLVSVVGNLTRSIDIMQRDMNANIDRRVDEAVSRAASQMAPVPVPVAVPPSVSSRGSTRAAPAVPAESPEEIARRRARERAQTERNESIYKPAEPPPLATPQQGAQARVAPRIAVYSSPDPEPVDQRQEMLSNIPDVQIPAGSILSAYLLTGLDAPTGTRAQQSPVPVLMRIKKEAILPNHAWADVMDCHLLGSAYGDLGSERVNIRGETVSCILRDNTAAEGSVRFFVAGEDGKNGIKGTLVSRSGRILAAAAGSALAQSHPL
ncbi:TrbI/VirB10 family protein [Falsigemmobacter intermedius]|uniref:TrbI/VirB10 family protein n=1 Tax=Falsigemmobacter intermedius TaxID=1553448 RepID=UPI0036201BF2